MGFLTRNFSASRKNHVGSNCTRNAFADLILRRRNCWYASMQRFDEVNVGNSVSNKGIKLILFLDVIWHKS